MGELADFAKQTSRFIKLADGESIEGIYQGFKRGSYMGNENVEYTIDGKILTSSSGKLALRMDNVKIGTKVKIKRFGVGYDTNYEVEIPGETAWDE